MKQAMTIRKAIDRLQAYYDCNHEVMDADDLGDLQTTLIELRCMYDEMAGVTKEIHTPYAEEYDQTFIMEDTFINGELRSTECIGWYFGEPNEEDTAQYADHRLKATY